MNTSDEQIEQPEQITAPEQLVRPAPPALDEILGKPFKVLDDGFVRVVDYMGGDQSIVQAARVSYGEGTKHVSEDQGLIRYLMRHLHTTPFEMAAIRFHVRVPMDCWRQWVRHRTSSINEYSTRYSIAIDATQQTDASEWRIQAAGNRQGSEGFLDEEKGAYYSQKEKELQDLSRTLYEERLEEGIAREQARKDLPLSTYTEAYWQVNLHNLLHFLQLRMDDYAQLEIREYAKTIGYEIVSQWCPIAWQAFLDYRVHALNLTRLEFEIIRAVQAGNNDEAIAIAIENRLLPRPGRPRRRNRERGELEEKLRSLNVPIPWEE